LTFQDDGQSEREYLYAVDGMLFSIRPSPPHPADGPSSLVEAAIAALP
jgi:hypothetical protein